MNLFSTLPAKPPSDYFQTYLRWIFAKCKLDMENNSKDEEVRYLIDPYFFRRLKGLE